MISFRKCGLDPTGSTAFEGIVTDIIRPSCDRILKTNLAAFTTHVLAGSSLRDCIGAGQWHRYDPRCDRALPGQLGSGSMRPQEIQKRLERDSPGSHGFLLRCPNLPDLSGPLHDASASLSTMLVAPAPLHCCFFSTPVRARASLDTPLPAWGGTNIAQNWTFWNVKSLASFTAILGHGYLFRCISSTYLGSHSVGW